MSDIVIKGMEMPKSCITGSIPNYEYCPFFTKCDKATSKESRPEDCPLVELPPHGDLIDRDELLNWKNITCVDTGYWETDYDCVKKEIVLKAPTILKSSEVTE